MWLIEAFFLHCYDFAEVYAVLCAWILIPLIYLFALTWLQRNGGLAVEFEGAGKDDALNAVHSVPEQGHTVVSEPEREEGEAVGSN